MKNVIICEAKPAAKYKPKIVMILLERLRGEVREVGLEKPMWRRFREGDARETRIESDKQHAWRGKLFVWHCVWLSECVTLSRRGGGKRLFGSDWNRYHSCLLGAKQSPGHRPSTIESGQPKWLRSRSSKVLNQNYKRWPHWLKYMIIPIIGDINRVLQSLKQWNLKYLREK